MNLLQIRTLARTLLSEPTASYWSDSELNNYINYGIADFCTRTDCLEMITTASLVAYQEDYTLPSDYTKIRQIEIVKGNSVYQLGPEDLQEGFTGMVKSTSNPPQYYNMWEGNLRLRERPSTAAASTTLNGAISTTTATSMTLTDSSSFPRTGRVLVDSEVIGYGLNTGSTEVLSVCTRGMEGTTAATHLTAATVTLRDIWIYHYKKGATLSSDTDTSSVPTQFHEAFAYYTAAIGRRKSKDHDLAKEYEGKYEGFVAKAKDWYKFRWKKTRIPK